jgi:hypothetical protein
LVSALLADTAELKSRRHRATARKEHLRKQENKRYNDYNNVWLSTAPRTDTDDAPIVPEVQSRRPIPKTESD